MLLQDILQALREIHRTASGPSPLHRKVALRWLQANRDQTYDLMLRLQILEGVAGVPPHSWWTRNLRGLALAQKFFASTPLRDSDWLTPANTGSYKRMSKGLRQLSQQAGIEADEAIHAALFGLSSDFSGARQNAIKFYASGKHQKDAILAGRKPHTAISKAGHLIARHLVNLIKKQRQQVPAEALKDMAVPQLDSNEMWGYLAAWLFDPSDSVGRALRNLMKSAWKGWRGEDAMLQWLARSMKARRPPPQQQMAEALGISAPVWAQSYWQPGWAKFVKTLRGKTTLLSQIEHRFLSLGFDADYLDFVNTLPSDTDIMPARVRGNRRRPHVSI